MIPTKTIPCRFFALGLCRNGESCHFIHDENLRQNGSASDAVALPAIEKLSVKADDAHQDDTSPQKPFDSRSMVLCIFHSRPGGCRNRACPYLHSGEGHEVDQKNGEVFELKEDMEENKDDKSPPKPPDSRSLVPCKFHSRPGGCRNDSCPYLHTGDDRKVEKENDLVESKEDKDEEDMNEFTRDFSGASVAFNEFGYVLKVSLPTDFSLALITGLAPGTVPEEIVIILRCLGFSVSVDCIRVRRPTPAKTTATVEVEDPTFAKQLSVKLKEQKSSISATSVSMDIWRSNCRKVKISWHKADKEVHLYFGSQHSNAMDVAQKFNDGVYKILGQSVKASRTNHGREYPRQSQPYSSDGPVIHYAVVDLKHVPTSATLVDIELSMKLMDRPRYIEEGRLRYIALDAQVGEKVRWRLEEHGPLENFYVSPSSQGKRVKATAWFQGEADARSACSLDSAQLRCLAYGKLTVTLIQSAEAKISTAIYLALKNQVDEQIKKWKQQHLTFHVYSDSVQRFTTIKVEGENAKNVDKACETLEKIFSGLVVVEYINQVVWDPALDSNGIAFKKLNSIEKELNVVLKREKSKRQIRFYGPPEKMPQAVRKITDGFFEEHGPRDYYIIDLAPAQLSRTFPQIRQMFDMAVVAIGPTCREYIVHGTWQQYKAVLAIVSDTLDAKGDCAICFCEADNPIETSCKHRYCLDCFEECCKSAASTSQQEFQVKCLGDEGACPTVFTLCELKEYVSSSVFETMLKSSFEEHVQRHLRDFHYCPTPNCGYIYRCRERSDNSEPYTCANCLKQFCTSCHVCHGDYTCAEHQEMISTKALEKLKKELDIRDCPKCTTPMEKTEGCNHMACPGCKVHICWGCMEVFETSGRCYDHMTEAHRGIGLDLVEYIG